MVYSRLAVAAGLLSRQQRVTLAVTGSYRHTPIKFLHASSNKAGCLLEKWTSRPPPSPTARPKAWHCRCSRRERVPGTQPRRFNSRSRRCDASTPRSARSWHVFGRSSRNSHSQRGSQTVGKRLARHVCRLRQPASNPAPLCVPHRQPVQISDPQRAGDLVTQRPGLLPGGGVRRPDDEHDVTGAVRSLQL